jgi:hypothetical protein
MSFQKWLEKEVLSRIFILWLGSMSVLWTVFAVGAYTHQDAWVNVQRVEPQTGWGVFWFILRNNFLILGLITLGNLFVRFGAVTPGLLILAIQLVTIGWTAGTNSFMEPFPSIKAANTAFVQIGLWEITAYISIYAITLNKSLLVADTFPAKTWANVTRLRDVRFSRTEISASVISLLALLFAAYTEAFLSVPIC